MQLASSPTSARLVFTVIAAAATFAVVRSWPEAEPTPEGPASVITTSLIPISGEALQQRVSEHDGSDDLVPPRAGGGCVPFVEPLIAHPNWSLQLVEGTSGCTGEWIHNVFEVTADGGVTWYVEGMAPRRLQLTRAELAVITAVNRYDCIQTDRPGYASSWLRISPGGGDPRSAGGAVISQSSMLALVVDGALSQAIERYRTERLAAVQPFELHLTAPGGRTPYRIEVDRRGKLTVRRGGRELIARQLDSAEQVDLFDRLLAQLFERLLARPLAPDISDEDLITGVLIFHGLRLEVTLSRWEGPASWVVWRTFDDAADMESSREKG